jgi:hypothetical protein
MGEKCLLHSLVPPILFHALSDGSAGWNGQADCLSHNFANYEFR